MHPILGEIAGLLEYRGAACYGRERVSQLEHALQYATLAEREGEGATPTLAAAASFVDMPHSGEAVRLRLWDDRAKVMDLATPPLRYFTETLRLLVLR